MTLRTLATASVCVFCLGLSCPRGLAQAILRTSAATQIGTRSAALNGTVSAVGQMGTAWFDYGLNPAYGSCSLNYPVIGIVNQPIRAPVSGLRPGATYHFRFQSHSPRAELSAAMTWPLRQRPNLQRFETGRSVL
jgi:hypothetical protein